MLVDFHTHTSASDGALSPEALLDRARAAGVNALAITDHDTVAGYLAVADGHPGLAVFPGVELSCVWSGATIHVVGLGMDVANAGFAAGLAQLSGARLKRAEKIAGRLATRGFSGALEGALACAGASQLGRPHFARWMVLQGHVPDEGTAFDRYLGRNKPGDVKAFWPGLDEVTGWIVAAGGIPVLAHPLQYRFTRMKLRRLVVDFKGAGGEGIEVLNGRQEASQIAALRRLAIEFELCASVGSDFHRESRYGADLGIEARSFNEMDTVWGRLRSAA